MSGVTFKCEWCGYWLSNPCFEKDKAAFCKNLIRDQYEMPEETKPAANVQQILDERGSRYGSFADNSDYAQRIIKVIDSAKQVRAMTGKPELQAHQVNALNMIAQKISRILSGDAAYADNWDDIAGFAQLGKNPR